MRAIFPSVLLLLATITARAQPSAAPDTSYRAAVLEHLADSACTTLLWRPLGTYPDRAAAVRAIGSRVGRVTEEVQVREPGTPYAQVVVSDPEYLDPRTR